MRKKHVVLFFVLGAFASSLLLTPVMAAEKVVVLKVPGCV